MLSDDIRDYDYTLPQELIAQEPSLIRNQARLLVVRREGSPRFEDLLVSDLPSLIKTEKRLQSALWVRNRSAVFPARFYAHRPSGSRHEFVLLEELQAGVWRCMVRGQASFVYPQVLIEPITQASVLCPEPGIVDLRGLEETFHNWIRRCGEMPLPPYIKKRDAARDLDRYQAVWADPNYAKSAAAPTASLHFNEGLVTQMFEAGARFVDILLHVGLGTFEPLRQNSLSAHELHSERIEVWPETLHQLESHQGPLVCVGTTALRCLESLGLHGSAPHPSLEFERDGVGGVRGRTRLFVRPGFEFRYTSALLTNFHLPQSTLLALVATFCGSRELALEAYEHAVRQRYRFFSYGDASLWL
jgi:S-adenosylmethionine:tRNA ribosyltransferase-isomerase